MGLTRRHNFVRDTIAQNLTSAGIPCEIEVTSPSGTVRPAAILFHSFDRRGPLACDVTVAHPLAPGCQTDQVTLSGFLKKREAAKKTNYRAICENVGWPFVSMAFSTLSSIGPEGRRLFNIICASLAGEHE